MTDWDEMCRMEPELLVLERQAKLIGADNKHENYEAMKECMARYVGWEAEKEELGSSEAWDIAMQHIAMRCAP